VLPWPYDSYRPLYYDWHAIQTAAGIPEGQHYVPKNCRSSCASGLIAAGIPTVVVKDFLGHEGVQTTENYYINTKPALRAVAEARTVVKVEP
jgi:integrase